MLYLCVSVCQDKRVSHSGLEGLLVQQCWESASKSHFSFRKDSTSYLLPWNVEKKRRNRTWWWWGFWSTFYDLYDDVFKDDYDMYDDDIDDFHDDFNDDDIDNDDDGSCIDKGQLLCHPLPIIGEINRYTGGSLNTQWYNDTRCSDTQRYKTQGTIRQNTLYWDIEWQSDIQWMNAQKNRTILVYCNIIVLYEIVFRAQMWNFKI